MLIIASFAKACAIYRILCSGVWRTQSRGNAHYVRSNSLSLVLRLKSVCSFHSLSCTCGADNFVHSQKRLRLQIFRVVVRGADKVEVSLISFALSRYSLDCKFTFANAHSNSLRSLQKMLNGIRLLNNISSHYAMLRA